MKVKIKLLKGGLQMHLLENKGVTAPRVFLQWYSLGVRKSLQTYLALIYSEVPGNAAGVYTKIK